MPPAKKGFLLTGLFLLLTLVGCGGGDGGTEDGFYDAEIRTFPAGTSWPQAIEGTLEISVEEGNVHEDGLSEINFGSIGDASGVYMIAVPANVAQSAGISREELVSMGTFHVEVDGMSEFSDPRFPTYQVSKIERLD